MSERMRTAFEWWLVFTAAGLLGLPGLVEAQQTIVNFSIEADNDFFLTFDPRRGTDHEYTHGARFWIELPDVPGLLQPLSAGFLGCEFVANYCRSRIEVGQEIYTPRYEINSGPIPGQRPHAGWLYFSFGIVTEDASASTSYHLQTGVVGPPALGHEFQAAVHDLLNFREPRGWDHQLPFEPGLLLHVDRSVRLFAARNKDAMLSGGYGWAVDLGSVLTQAGGNLSVEFCYGRLNCGGRVDLGEGVPIGLILRGEGDQG